jgi:hypothetical protein
MHACVDAWIAGEWHAQDVCDPLEVLLLHPACRHGWRTHADAARRQRTPVARDAVLAERGERAYVRRESRAFNKGGLSEAQDICVSHADHHADHHHDHDHPREISKNNNNNKSPQ